MTRGLSPAVLRDVKVFIDNGRPAGDAVRLALELDVYRAELTRRLEKAS